MVWTRVESRKCYTKKVLTETIHKKISLGRPRTRWKDRKEHLDRNVSVQLAFDRE